MSADLNEDAITRFSALLGSAAAREDAARRIPRLIFALLVGIVFLVGLAMMVATLYRLATGVIAPSNLAQNPGFFVAVPFCGWLLWKHRRLDVDHRTDASVMSLLIAASFSYGIWINGLRGLPLMLTFVVFAFITLPRKRALVFYLYLVGLVATYGVIGSVEFAEYSRGLIALGALGPMMFLFVRFDQDRQALLQDAVQSMEEAVERLAEAKDEIESKWKMLEELLDESPEGIAFTHDARFVYTNRSYTRFTGFAAGDDAKRAFLNPEARDDLMTALQRDGVVRDREVALHGADGEARLFVATFKEGRYRNMDVVMGWLQDVTEERRARREAELHAIANDQIIRNSPVGIGFAVGDHFREGNSVLLDTFDLKPGSLAWSLTHPEDIAKYQGVPPADWAAPRELRVRDREGRYRPCLVKGVRITKNGERGSVIWVIDLSQIRAAEAEAAIAHQRLISALDSLDVMISLTDAEDRIVFANRKLLELEAPVAETLSPGQPYADFLRASAQHDPIAGATGRVEAWVEERLSQRRTTSAPVEQRRGSGQWLLMSDHRLPDGGVISVGTDITVIKQAQLEMQRAKESAEESVRLKSDFIASMSHEIRTPMNAIIGMCYLALQGSLAPREREQVDKAYRAAQELLRLLNDFLDFSSLESGRVRLDPVVFRLGDLLDSVESRFAPRALEKRLELRIECAPEVSPVLLGDPLRLKQVLEHLCDNAVKFTERGSVEVRVSRLEEDSDHVRLQFCVHDSGIGIPSERCARLFSGLSQMDSSASRHFGGTGIGLGLARRVVELMDGRIWVESTPGVGSKFCFTARLGRASASALATPPEHKTSEGGLTPVELPEKPRTVAAGVRTKLVQGLAELRPLLEQGDASAVDRGISVAMLAEDSEHAKGIRRHLENYDFESALASLDAWLGELGEDAKQ